MTDTTQFELTGFKEFADLLDALPDDLAAKTIKSAFYQGAKIVRDAAKANCPVMAEDKVVDGKMRKSGQLRDAIRIMRPTEKQSIKNDMLLYIVKCKNALSHIVEYGTAPRTQKNGRRTGSMPARSFMRKAIDEKSGAALDAIQQGCEAGLEKSAIEVAKRTGALK